MLKKIQEFAEKNAVFLIAVPLIIGGIGYRLQGESLLNAFYSSFCLYFANPVSDDYNILIELARWTAPVAMVAGISKILLAHLKDQYRKISFFFLQGKYVFYSNYVKEDDLNPKMRRNSIVITDEAKNWKNKKHIIMFDNDFENFSFYRKYEKVLADKEVYMCLYSMDPTLLKMTDKNRVYFFHINDAIARMFWKGTNTENEDCDRCKVIKDEVMEAKECKIAIFGFGDLGKHMLESALQLHLYSKDQQITYYVIGECGKYEAAHKALDLMNKDKIVYLREEQLEDWFMLHEMDMIILTEKPNIEQIQMVLGNSDCNVYYYSPAGDTFDGMADTKRLVAYGQNEKLLTKENIIWNELYSKAMDHNAEYNNSKRTQEAKKKLEGESEEDRKKRIKSEWNKLPGFLQESNISSEDYGENIRKLYLGRKCDVEKLAELEHIRWCRFHFLHYWKQGAGKDGKKDEPNKLHPSLVPYREVEEGVKDYDRDSVNRWLKDR